MSIPTTGIVANLELNVGAMRSVLSPTLGAFCILFCPPGGGRLFQETLLSLSDYQKSTADIGEGV